MSGLRSGHGQVHQDHYVASAPVTLRHRNENPSMPTFTQGPGIEAWTFQSTLNVVSAIFTQNYGVVAACYRNQKELCFPPRSITIADSGRQTTSLTSFQATVMMTNPDMETNAREANSDSLNFRLTTEWFLGQRPKRQENIMTRGCVAK